jgi:hypothetical protein
VETHFFSHIEYTMAEKPGPCVKETAVLAQQVTDFTKGTTPGPERHLVLFQES